ncbi:MAG: S-layer homology domain-containing protein, partial [Oscillospiraceae bacterium]|nr:S-layer homology domain-containing protein [Oscillospiraceae bacterium]
PLDVTATYNMAGYNYTLRDLGDGFAMFGGAVNVKDYVMEDYLVLANYAKSFPVENGYPTIKADNSVLGANYGDINGEGRIKIVAEEESEPITFTDVKETDWFYEFVMEAAEEGYIIGYPDGTFLPNKNVTRAEFAEMLYRAMGGPAELPEGVESSFADVTENQWYYVSVTMLAEAGIIVGRDEDTFDPNATITREEMVTILYRVYKLGYGEDAETPDQSVLEAFTDSAAISDYAVDAFAWAIEWGAIEGMGDNTLAPKGRTTRAQAATVLTRLD